MPHDKECCQKFDPQPWDGITHEWKNKLFIKKTISQLFHMPIPWVYSKTLTAMWEQAKSHGIAPDIKDFLLLAYDPSPWKSELYLYVLREHKDVENIVPMNGRYISKVFDGPYQNVPKYMKEMELFLQKQGERAKKYYFYFTTCPECAKKYGHNYIVVFTEV